MAAWTGRRADFIPRPYAALANGDCEHAADRHQPEIDRPAAEVFAYGTDPARLGE